MIRYSLICEQGHKTEGWFKSSEAFDKQKEMKHIQCAACGSTDVNKALMAPNLGKSSKSEEVETAPQEDSTVLNETIETIRKLRKHIEDNAENVGNKFAEEARKIHYEEAEPRGIYGQASKTEIKELKEEGVACTPLPDLPEDHN